MSLVASNLPTMVLISDGLSDYYAQVRRKKKSQIIKEILRLRTHFLVTKGSRKKGEVKAGPCYGRKKFRKKGRPQSSRGRGG